MSDFDIDISELNKIPTFLNNAQHRVLPKSNRQAINKTVTASKKIVSDQVRLIYNLKPAEIKKRFMRITKARGNNVYKQEGTVGIDSSPINKLRFLPNSKRKVMNQKGVAVRKRRPLRFEITPGQKKTHKKDFVQKGKGGNLLVFRREGSGRGKLRAQKLPGLAKKLESSGRIVSILNNIADRYSKEFTTAFENNLNKLRG